MSDWQTPEFVNGWQAWPENPMRYRIPAPGVIDIKGVAVAGQPGTVIFYLPPETWPEKLPQRTVSEHQDFTIDEKGGLIINRSLGQQP